jgi:hypothetical protein
MKFAWLTLLQDDMREAFQASLVNLPAADPQELTPLSLSRPRGGPSLPSVMRPIPATDEELVASSHPSTALNRAGRAVAVPSITAGYERTVPRLVAGAAGAAGTNVIQPLVTVNPSPGYAGRIQFTPQVVLHLKKWLYDRMVADPASGIPYLSDEEKTELASALNLSVRQIAQWFQNRRKDYAHAVRAHQDYVSMLHEQINAGATASRD